MEIGQTYTDEYIMWDVLTTIIKKSITRLETTVNVRSQYLLTNIFMFCIFNSRLAYNER